MEDLIADFVGEGELIRLTGSYFFVDLEKFWFFINQLNNIVIIQYHPGRYTPYGRNRMRRYNGQKARISGVSIVDSGEQFKLDFGEVTLFVHSKEDFQPLEEVHKRQKELMEELQANLEF